MADKTVIVSDTSWIDRSTVDGVTTEQPHVPPELDEALEYIKWATEIPNDEWETLSDTQRKTICLQLDLCSRVVTIWKTNGRPQPGGGFYRT